MTRPLPPSPSSARPRFTVGDPVQVRNDLASGDVIAVEPNAGDAPPPPTSCGPRAPSAGIGRGSASARARYDSAVLSVGQRARDLLTGKPAAWWNLTQRRIEQLEPQHEGAERYAVEAERAAAAARQRADRLRGELETARARLAELEAAGARVT